MIPWTQYYNDKNGCERQEYIKFIRPDSYSWIPRPIKKNYRAMIQWVKEHIYWNYVKEVYLDKKNSEPDKKSRIIFYQTILEIYESN